MHLKIKKPAPLLQALEELFPDSSKTTLRNWIKMGRITRQNKRICDPRLFLKANTSLYLENKVKKAGYGIKILYEDVDLVALQKPAGLLSVSTDFEVRETVHAVLKERTYKRCVFPVHRLDQKTSGVMVFAYSVRAKEGLKKQFFTHSITRKYLALVEGCMKTKKGKWESFLKEDENYFVSSHPDGKRAITHYEIISVTPQFTALTLQLETGRKNQIRAHASEAGHPVVGDRKYGATQKNPLKQMGLHAYYLSFIHPVLKKKMEFKSFFPARFSHYFKDICSP